MLGKEKIVAYNRLPELIAQKPKSEYGTTLAPCLPRLGHVFSLRLEHVSIRFPYFLLRRIKQILYFAIGVSIEWTSSIQNTMQENVGLIFPVGV